MNQGKETAAPAPGTTSLLRPHMPELDSVRGLAILLVLLFHGTAVPFRAQLSGFGRLFFAVAEHGDAGVNLFFVLSGFLITGILLDSRNNPGYFRRFYIRRALRILPAFYATLSLLLIGGWISGQFALLSVLFLANSTPLLGVPLQYGPLWSLAVEEHFYLLWPSLVRRLSPRMLAAAAITVVVVTPVLREWAAFSGRYAADASLRTWFNADGLALGALLAIWLRRPSFRREYLSRAALPALVAGVIAYVIVCHHPSMEAALLVSCRNLASAGWLGCMLLLWSSRRKYLADVPFLAFLGFISYGLYLIHVLSFRIVEMLLWREFATLISHGSATAAMFLRLAAGSGLAILIAYLSRHSLEETFLRMGFASRSKEICIEAQTAVERA